mgnify:CR=1 FL=1
MAYIKDTGIVYLYEKDGDGTPVLFHRVDAKDALNHPSGHWLTSPQVAAWEPGSIRDAQPLKIKQDTGQEIKLKGTPFKTLRTMARDANIENYISMDKAALVNALIAAKIE